MGKKGENLTCQMQYDALDNIKDRIFFDGT